MISNGDLYHLNYIFKNNIVLKKAEEKAIHNLYCLFFLGIKQNILSQIPKVWVSINNFDDVEFVESIEFGIHQSIFIYIRRRILALKGY
jgi:hypothetical protein